MKILGLDLTNDYERGGFAAIFPKTHGLDLHVAQRIGSLWVGSATVRGLTITTNGFARAEDAGAALDIGLRKLWGAMAMIAEQGARV